MTSQLDMEMKKRYAREIILNKGDDYKAALALVEHPGPALQLRAAWHDDPEVIAEMERIRKTEPGLGTPNETELLEELWKIGTNPVVKEKDRIEALKQYALIKGYTKTEDKRETVVPSVMVVPGLGVDNWETVAIQQQRKSTVRMEN